MSSIFNTSSGGIGSSASGQCHVIAGSHTIRQDAPVQVSTLRRNVKVVYPNLSNDAFCYHGTDALSEDDTVEPGWTVNFMRKLGEKGSH